MKKIILIIFLTSAMQQAMAQAPGNVLLEDYPGSQASLHATLTHRFSWNHSSDNARTSSLSGNWLDYSFVADSIAEFEGSQPLSFYDYLFPDSSVVICDASNNCVNPFTHLIGNILDANSAIMQRIFGYSWSNTNPYTVDSLAIVYSYIKNDNSVVDTLVAYLWDNEVESDIDTTLYFVFPIADYDVDTVRAGLLPYDSTGTNMPKPSAGALQIFKIPLVESDTSSNEGLIVINTNSFSVPAGKLVASAFGFIPGYTYSPGETISTGENVFAFISDEPNGAGTYAPYFPGDWNSSSIIPNTVRYNYSATGWDGSFIPTYAYPSGYQSQEHEISYYVTGVFDAGINESVSPEGIRLYQNQPNPANHTTLIKYDTQTSGPVTLEVTDLTGRIVMEMNQGTQSADLHSVNLDVSGLSQGMYLYTLRTNGGSLTRRMVINE